LGWFFLLCVLVCVNSVRHPTCEGGKGPERRVRGVRNASQGGVSLPPSPLLLWAPFPLVRPPSRFGPYISLLRSIRSGAQAAAADSLARLCCASPLSTLAKSKSNSLYSHCMYQPMHTPYEIMAATAAAAAASCRCRPFHLHLGQSQSWGLATTTTTNRQAGSSGSKGKGQGRGARATTDTLLTTRRSKRSSPLSRPSGPREGRGGRTRRLCRVVVLGE
jgi:hypothetical protein